MKNDFGYISNKPFEEVDEAKEKQAIFNLYDDKLEIKVRDASMFNSFDRITKVGKIIEKEIYYALNNKGYPITLYNTSILKSNFSAISDSTLNCEMYIIGRQSSENIRHFTENTKIRKILYYHDDLIRVFGNSSVIAKDKISKKGKILKVDYKAKKINKLKLCDISLDGYSMSIFLNQAFSFNMNYNTYEYSITPKTYMTITFNKGINFDEVYKIRKRMDSVIHLITFAKKRNETLELFCSKNLSYVFNDLTIKNINKKSIFMLNDGKDKVDNFIKLFKTMINIDEDESNSFLPFLNFDRISSSLEIQFLEYYRVLEFMNVLSQKKKQKEKNKTFLLPLIKKYTILKNRFFPNDKEEVIEEEIRNLRNHYSHFGYYIKELRIPTETNKTLKYLKPIDHQWIYDVMIFVRTLAYLELYALSNIIVSENEIVNRVN